VNCWTVLAWLGRLAFCFCYKVDGAVFICSYSALQQHVHIDFQNIVQQLHLSIPIYVDVEIRFELIWEKCFRLNEFVKAFLGISHNINQR
jgi:hypothetical protein